MVKTNGHGGPRPNSGRPKGSKNQTPRVDGARHKRGIVLDDETLSIWNSIQGDKSAWLRRAIVEAHALTSVPECPNGVDVAAGVMPGRIFLAVDNNDNAAGLDLTREEAIIVGRGLLARARENS